MRLMIRDQVQIQTCVTSPPYWRLRDYGVRGQIGLEPTFEAYVAEMVGVFRLVRELLVPDGTLWLNLGDCYASGGKPGISDLVQFGRRFRGGGHKHHRIQKPSRSVPQGMKAKDLLGLPWHIAFALRADGWYLRSDIVWVKPNAMPENVRDRPTRVHEFVFLLAKSSRYYYDHAAICEPVTSGPSDIRKMVEGRARLGGKHKLLVDPYSKASAATNIGRKRSVGNGRTRNKRTVWSIATAGFRGAHFAVFPKKLVEPCIQAGSRPTDVVFDPFAGRGTTREVATALGRRYVGCELNPAFVEEAALRSGK
jgi:DNA modification methylase